jgi:hypothetical protein
VKPRAHGFRARCARCGLGGGSLCTAAATPGPTAPEAARPGPGGPEARREARRRTAGSCRARASPPSRADPGIRQGRVVGQQHRPAFSRGRPGSASRRRLARPHLLRHLQRQAGRPGRGGGRRRHRPRRPAAGPAPGARGRRPPAPAAGRAPTAASVPAAWVAPARAGWAGCAPPAG